MKDIFVPVHLCLGQESVAADIHEHIRPEDWLFSHHRNHGHYLAKGGSEQKLWDEIMGLETGLNGGFAGSQGISDSSINFHASAIVGGLVGVATGTAYALKMDKSKAIAVCVLGDGGTEAGVFWESLNFAALHKLRIAYIVENNEKSVDAHISERQATPLVPRAAAFGVRIAGSIEGALQLARSGRPSFYEAKVTLRCSHINMGALEPKDVIA
jgi:TPP-dependent pyruvate/acetoin dehydrogenase alpha subunit